MSHFIRLFTFLILPFYSLATLCIPDCECETDWTLQVRGAYYYIPSRPIEKIYTHHWLDYQVEAAKRIHPFVEAWIGLDWAGKRGHAYYSVERCTIKNKTRMFILPVNFGFKAIYPIFPYVDLYAGAGLCYSFLKIKNTCKHNQKSYECTCHGSPVTKGIYKNEWGAVFKVGFQYAMSDSTFLDFFTDYYAQTFRFPDKKRQAERAIFRHSLNCSGFKYGIGFGVYF